MKQKGAPPSLGYLEIMKINRDLLKHPNLVPFYGCFILYYILYRPFVDYPPLTLMAVLFKCLPIWSLVYYIKATTQGPQWYRKPFLPDDYYCQNIIVGLLCSSVGDALLLSRVTLFIFGLLAFAVAHVFYNIAMGPAPLQTKNRDLYILGGMVCFLVIQEGIDSFIMKGLVLMYISLIFSVGWRATSRYQYYKTDALLYGSIGGLIFIFSDLIIAVDKWRFGIPASQFLVMTSYYTGQLGIALSCTPPK
ncbi:hypothetical protein ScPMuIL_013744 [Solemya velum]